MKNRRADLEPYIDIDALEEIIYESIRDALENSDFIRNGKPLFFSISMKIEPDGKAIVESFGNMTSAKKLPGNSAGKNMRDIFAEVTESEKEITVTLELPFAKENDIDVKIFETKIVVSGLKPECFYKQIVLEKPVIAEKAKKAFKNGILEIILPKKV